MDARQRWVAWLAALLDAARARQQAAGTYRGHDDLRSLHVPDAAASASLRSCTDPPAWDPIHRADWERLPRWRVDDLAATIGLSPAEQLVVVVTVLVELAPGLRPALAVLQDDPAVRQPTVGTLAELAGAVGFEVDEIRHACRADDRLRSLGLLHAVEVPSRPSLLDHLLVADEWLVATASGLDASLPPDATWYRAGSGAAALPWPTDQPAVVHGADHDSQRDAVAASAGVESVVVVEPGAPASAIVAAARAAACAGTVAVVEVTTTADVEAVRPHVAPLARAGARLAVSVAGAPAWVPPRGWADVRCPRPTTEDRRRRWREALVDRGLRADADDVHDVAASFGLGLAAIDRAADDLARTSHGGCPGREALRRAARRSGWRDLSAVARHEPVTAGWADLVVADAVRQQLGEIAAGIRARGVVMSEWEFGGRPGSRGIHVLFAGPSGTGKTLAARVIATEVGMDLWVVDLARVVDKYLGETEKALDRALAAADDADVLLVFDEADALFGKRGDVREARDRWANLEVAYLLQRLESHDGVTALTTNLGHHLDDAFARRLNHRVEFTMPDRVARTELWRRSVPDAAPLAATADLDVVAERFDLSGGAIRTAAVNAAYDAASRGHSISLEHLVRAAVRELAKAGRPPTRSDLGELAALLPEPGRPP